MDKFVLSTKEKLLCQHGQNVYCLLTDEDYIAILWYCYWENNIKDHRWMFGGAIDKQGLYTQEGKTIPHEVISTMLHYWKMRRML
jgi:hypothetical protein